jgi:hypothetical protein
MPKLKNGRPIKLEDGILCFIIPPGQDWTAWAKGETAIFATYIARDDIEWMRNIKINKGMSGNLGPNEDMVYFSSNYDDDHYTIAIPIELILFNKDFFKGIEPPLRMVNLC